MPKFKGPFLPDALVQFRILPHRLRHDLHRLGDRDVREGFRRVGLGSRFFVRSYAIRSVRSTTASRACSTPGRGNCRCVGSSFSLLPPPKTCFLNHNT